MLSFDEKSQIHHSTKADEIDRAKTDYLQLFMISTECQHKKNQRVSETFRSVLIFFG